MRVGFMLDGIELSATVFWMDDSACEIDEIVYGGRTYAPIECELITSDAHAERIIRDHMAGYGIMEMETV